MFGWKRSDRSRPAKPLVCSFCGKDSETVQSLLAGPKVFICNECVAACNRILDAEGRPASC